MSQLRWANVRTTYVCWLGTERKLNKASTSDKETSFQDLNIQVIGSDVHTSVYDKRDDFGFPIVNFPGWVVMFLDSNLMVFTFLSLLGVAQAFQISILKIFRLLPNYWHRVTYITSFEIHLESSSGHTLTFYLNLVKYRFQNLFRKEFLTRSSTVI